MHHFLNKLLSLSAADRKAILGFYYFLSSTLTTFTYSGAESFSIFLGSLFYYSYNTSYGLFRFTESLL